MAKNDVKAGEQPAESQAEVSSADLATQQLQKLVDFAVDKVGSQVFLRRPEDWFEYQYKIGMLAAQIATATALQQLASVATAQAVAVPVAATKT